MSLEPWSVVAVGVLMLIVVTMGISLWVVARRASEQSDDLSNWTRLELQKLSTRVAQLEDMDRRFSRPASAGSSEGGKVDPRPLDTASSEASTSDVVAPTARSTPPTLEDFYEEAGGALASANTFVTFAEKYRGQGFVLEPDRPTPSPASGSADRADIYLLTVEGYRLVLPGFNLRRGQGLLTSDAGRAAEARLGWLFEIETGPELRAIEAARVDLGDWTVRRKGRLSIPL